MQKTGSQVQEDVFRFLKESELSKAISGKVYKDDTRPRDSRKEDAVVVFTAGIPGEIQEGVVTINIHVPDLKPFRNGVTAKDVRRCGEIEALAQAWVESLTAAKSPYLFSLQESIHTVADDAISQHFIVVKLNFRVTTF